MRKSIYQFAVLLICFVIVSVSYGAIEPVNVRVQGDDLYALNGSATTLDISDNKYYLIESGYYLGMFEDVNVKNTITLGIDESRMDEGQDPYAFRVSFDVEYTRLISGDLVTSEMNGMKLDINYDPLRGSKYKDRAVFSFTGGLDVKITITDIEEMTGIGWVSLTSNTLKKSVFLESEIVTERYYSFDQTFVPSPVMTVEQITVSSDLKEIKVTWPHIEGAEDYEFEWTWVNGYTDAVDGSGNPVVETDPALLTYNFLENATRVRLEGANSYTIPHIYGDGYLAFRYRGVGRGGSYYSIPLEGTWSSDGTTGGASGVLSSYPNYISVSAHEGNEINYGAGMSFIENGVRSTGVTYMDGVLKPRQSQAQLNSQEKIIVGSTIYDHYGRPAIGVMSSPVSQSYLGYVENLNMHSDGTPYNKNHFNLDATSLDGVGCGEFLAAEPMDAATSNGAAYYYSEENADQEGFNAYLPDAEGYPFVHIQYDNDPTGRVVRVGGVGQDHQIGQITIGSEIHDAHYTEYFYTLPDEDELYRLFGNDATKSANYTKVITKDVHGQMTVAIIDAMGRTVVTYMMGDAPNGLDEIEGNDEAGTVTNNFSDYNDPNEMEGILLVEYPLFVENAGSPYEFNYDFTAAAFVDECIPSNLDICFDCVYEIEIRIIPDEFNPAIPDCLISDGINPVADSETGEVTMTYTVGSITSFDADCEENPLTFSGVNPGDETFTLYFPKIGTYYVYKELKVSQAPIDYYWDIYVSNSECLLTETDFLDDALSNIDPSDCEDMTPCEFNFLLEYGTEAAYISNGGTAGEYASAHTAYLETCGALNPCEVLLPQMLADLSAGGQYGAPAIVGTSADDLATSIFSGAALYPSGMNFHDYGPFYNSDGTLSYIDLTGDGIPETQPHASTVSSYDFYTHWQDSWAINFLELHPEYCYYQFCNDNSDIFDYEQDLNSILTFDEACAAGLLNYVPELPSNWSTSLPVYPTLCPPTSSGVSVNEDPVFSNFSSSTSSTALDDDMLDIWLQGFNDGTTTWDIYEFSVLLCGEDPTMVDFGDGCNKDKHWMAFKALYLGRRFQMIDLLKKDYTLNNCPNAFCVGTTSDPNCSLDPNPFENKVPRYFNYNTAFFNLANAGSTSWTTLATNAETDIDDACSNQCTSMADIWMGQLAGCEALLTGIGETWDPGETTYDAIEADLIEVCTEGCNSEWPFVAQSNPSGSSGSAPFDSFQSVLEYYFTTETLTCNHLLVTFPAPGSGSQSINKTLNGCACDALLSSTDINDFSAKFGFIPNDYSSEKCICEEHESDPDWTTLEALDIPTSNNFKCSDDCLTCELLTFDNGFIDQFESAYGVSYYEEPALFTAFVNENSTYSYSYAQITELIENCNALVTGGSTPIYNLLNPEVNDLVDLLTALAENDLAATTNNYSHLTLSEYFYSSLYPCTDPATGDFDYVPTPSGNNISFAIDDVACSSTCTIDLDLVGSLPTEFSNAADMYDHLLYFSNPYILASAYLGLSSTSPDLHVFYATATLQNPDGTTQDVVFEITIPCYDVIDYYEYEDSVSRDPSFHICAGEFVAEPGNSCMEEMIEAAEITAHENYLEYLAVQYEIFKASYINQCRQVQEDFTLEYQSNRYHYTLLYYDLSGNLLKTVPPMGVAHLSDAELNMLHAYIENPVVQPIPQYPNHQFVTSYKYNALNQVVEMNTPDGGTSNFWYDFLGRPVLTQNARQAEFNTTIVDGDPAGSGDDIPAYSYVRYDELGRVYEAGEIIHPTTMTFGLCKDWLALDDWFTDEDVTISSVTYPVIRNNITQIYYDEKYSTAAETEFGAAGYGETRNRITATSVITGYVTPSSGWNYPAADYINHYQYDVHGNVSAFLQEITALDEYDNRFLRVDYEYDLISGNPNYIYFQKDKPDQFIHQYRYDADNRLAEVYTSSDGIIWNRDADYEYREDGYLARTELGEMKVQGMDYAYTLHGWIKALNSGVLDSDNDMGRDGEQSPSAEYDSYENEVHGLVARDVLAYTVGYYTGDYKAISRNQTGYTNMMASISPSSGFAMDNTSLFNGNITSLIMNMTDYDGGKLDVTANTYHYDQLHRFKLMHVFSTTAADAATYNSVDNASRHNVGVDISGMGDYEMAVSYDQNGNITDLVRMAYGTSNIMDQFVYYNKREDGTTTYNASAGNPIDFNTPGQGYTNRLDYVDDNAGNTASYDDIEDTQSAGNYTYHADGTLKSDADEYIHYIDWYPGGLLKRVYRDGTTQDPDLYFEYDPMGRRVLKVEITRDGSFDIESADLWKYTYYAYDANGINMGVYSLNLEPTLDELSRIEAIIYGGSRIGTEITEILVNERTDPGSCTEACLQTVVVQISNPLPYGEPDILVNQDATPIHTAVPFTANYYETAHNLANAIQAANTDLFVYVTNPGVGIYQVVIEEKTPGALCGDLTLTLDGSDATNTYLFRQALNECLSERVLGNKFYEITNYLGNVNEVIADRKIAVDVNTDDVTDYYEADVISYADYYPYGMEMPGRFGSRPTIDELYRYGYNGMEFDHELAHNRNSYTTQFRQYDPRLGRWKSLDPLAGKYPNLSPYCAFNDNPIFYKDPFGLEGSGVGDGAKSAGNFTDRRKAKKAAKDFAAKNGIDKKDYKLVRSRSTGNWWMDYGGKDGSICTHKVFDAQTENSESNNVSLSKNEGQSVFDMIWDVFQAIDKAMKELGSGKDPLVGTSNGDVGFIKQGNGDFVKMDGSQYVNEDHGLGGYGAAIKSPQNFGSEPIYVDASYMPGSIAGGSGGSGLRENKTFTVTYKGQSRTFNSWQKADIDDLDDLFDTDGAEIFFKMVQSFNNGTTIYDEVGNVINAGQTPELTPPSEDSVRVRVDGELYLVHPDSGDGSGWYYPTITNSRKQ